jgi:sterol desaturase/sphingolipid hydroxylase (fatty acid hydroxylase superfamily)
MVSNIEVVEAPRAIQSGSRRTAGRLIVSSSFTMLAIGLSVWVPLHFASSSVGGALEFAAIGLSIGLVNTMVWSVVELLSSAAGPRKPLIRWLIDVQMSYCFLSTIAIGGLFAGIMLKALNSHFHLGFMDLRFAHGNDALTLLAVLLLSITLFDFLFYWYHRASHVLPVLWQLHKVHHMDQRLSASTTNVMSGIEGFLRPVLLQVPFAFLFKLDNVNYLGAGLAGGLIVLVASQYAFFSHANIKVGFGKASMLLNNPQLHRIHHSRLPEHRDRNFANTTPLWDVIFGTYYAPKPGEYPPTGVEGEEDRDSLVSAQLVALRGWRQLFREWRGRRAASAA